MQEPDFWNEVERLFGELDALDTAEQSERLEALAAKNPELHQEVQSLLAQATFEDTRIAEAIRSATTESAGEAASLEPGAQLDEYTIVRLVGIGGMGEVYEATQEQPVRRTVALKLIRRGMDSPQVLARFESERQALALMHHPSIASVYDAGTSADGRPYFVMELVPGKAIDRSCDDERMSIEDRLRLFAAVCRGVHHAHQRGVIHRDLKPSNILVTRLGGETVPKVIDFGIAKATHGRLGEHSVHTRLDQWVGTPEFMSPEQASSGGSDVDVRSDVFSLGAVLFELLVGRSHLDVEAGATARLVAALQDTDAVAPSRRLSTLGDGAAEPSSRRGTSASMLQRRLQGELDWIVLRALERDRERRYASAADLADDIERHLQNQPVLAGPPSVTYRARKFVRRHRVACAAAALATISLLVGSTLATVGLVRARQAEREAVEEATAANQVTNFLVGLFAASNPNTERRAEATARELLDRGASQLNEELADQPAVRARLLTEIGRVYESLGLFDQAKAQLESAVELYRSLPDEEVELSEALDLLATVLYRTQGEGAESIAKEALDIRLRRLEDNDQRIGTTWKTLGVALLMRGDYEGTEAAFRESLAIAEANPDDVAKLSDRLQSVAGILDIQSRPDEAVSYVERAIAIFEEGADPDDPWLGHLYDGLGIVRSHTQDYAGAEDAFIRSVEQRRRTLGDQHHTVGESWGNVGELYINTERWEQARDALDRAVAILTEAYSADHLRVINFRDQLALAHAGLGDIELARALLEENILIRDEAIPHDHPDSGLSRQNLGAVELEAGNPARARELLEAAWDRRLPAVGAEHPEMVALRAQLDALTGPNTATAKESGNP